MPRESKAPNLHIELFQRHPNNPILTAQDWPYPAHTGVQCGRVPGGGRDDPAGAASKIAAAIRT